MTCHDAGRQLGSYIDDELGPGEAAAMADHIEGCATCRHRLAELESLGRLVRTVPYRAAPDRARMKIAGSSRRARISSRTLAWAATVILVVAVGGTASFRARQTARETSALAEDVVNHHVSALKSGHLFDVGSSSQHTVKPWFQGRLDFSPPVADLASAGFPLIGGRVDAIGGRSVAALVYQRRAHVIHVFVWPARGRTATGDVPSIRGFQQQRWMHADLSLWAVSDLDDRELHEFARAFESSYR
jgi:anti-sigma factor RsiW